MTETDTPSRIERPSAKDLSRYRADIAVMRADTVRTFLTNGWSLAVCCCDCPRLVEWTPPELLEKFGERLDLSIADIARRIACTGAEGCGSKNVAVFPWPYALDWKWPSELPL
jgi:hypothetical protein